MGQTDGRVDGRTDGRTTERYIDPAPHAMPAVSIGNENVPEIITNNTINLFLNCYQHFANFKR